MIFFYSILNFTQSTAPSFYRLFVEYISNNNSSGRKQSKSLSPVISIFRAMIYFHSVKLWLRVHEKKTKLISVVVVVVSPHLYEAFNSLCDNVIWQPVSHSKSGMLVFLQLLERLEICDRKVLSNDKTKSKRIYFEFHGTYSLHHTWIIIHGAFLLLCERGIQWKRMKNKGRESSMRIQLSLTSKESHVETLIYLWLQNTTKLSFSVCEWKVGKRSLTVSAWNLRKCRREIPHHLQFFGCCRSIRSIPGFVHQLFMLKVKLFVKWKGSCF